LGRDDRLTLRQIIALGEGLYWRKIEEALAILEPDERTALVYIHGYNVGFEEAAIRAAQLGCDLKIQGATAFFSWPSRGSLKGYVADEASIEASESYIRDFLIDMALKSGAARVHIIAHSMGNRGLLRSIERIASAARERSGIKFGQILLAAPDVDADVFRAIAHYYPQVSARTTLYVSSRDKALGMSEFLHGFNRAGFTPPVTIVAGLDTVEVTNIDLTVLGHGYYGEAEAVLYDMHQLLSSNAPPDERIRIREAADVTNGRYWLIGA
jgi:esterase/lipase superfamily enzyme